MKNIPPIILILFFLNAAGLYGQTQQPNPIPTPSKASGDCNYAGTWTRGPFVGQSNDTAGDPIFLCFGDSIFIDHNGDQVINCPPQPGLPPIGVAYALYECPPAVSCGLLDPPGNEPCFWSGSATDFWATGYPSGDTWFYNNGGIISAAVFGNGMPVKITYAPVTMRTHSAGDNSCIDANPKAAFNIVYLNRISAVGINANYGNDCLGKFNLRGGLPQWDTTQTYVVNISKVGNPAISGLPYSPAEGWKNGNAVIFSVPVTGMYEVTVRDGKSCGSTFQVDMNGCVAGDNLTWALPAVSAKPGEYICLPLTVKNSGFFLASLSVTWNPAILTFVEAIKKPHPPAQDFNLWLDPEIAQGKLGLTFQSNAIIPMGLNFPDGDTLVELCFEVKGPENSFSDLAINGAQMPIIADWPDGSSHAVSVLNGKVDVLEPRAAAKPVSAFTIRLAPNTIRQGHSTTLLTQLAEPGVVTVRLCDLAGRILSEHRLPANAGSNRLELPTYQLPSGLYFVLSSDETGAIAPALPLIIQGATTGF